MTDEEKRQLVLLSRLRSNKKILGCFRTVVDEDFYRESDVDFDSWYADLLELLGLK